MGSAVISPRQAEVLAIIVREGRVGRARIAHELGICGATVGAHLHELRLLGEVLCTARGQNALWRVRQPHEPIPACGSRQKTAEEAACFKHEWKHVGEWVLHRPRGPVSVWDLVLHKRAAR